MRIKPTIKNFTTAKELVNALNPLSDWREGLMKDQLYQNSEWMYFRGQFQAGWNLVPSALSSMGPIGQIHP